MLHFAIIAHDSTPWGESMGEVVERESAVDRFTTTFPYPPTCHSRQF